MTPADSKNSRKSITDLLVHLHPPTVSEETLRFNLSFGLGGMSAILIFLLFATGILQLLSYDPSVVGAYASVQEMYTHVLLGGWVRNIHYWSANLLVIIAVLHLLRVFLTGAIGPGRRLNWIIGLVLMLFVLAANFSGYLLPWDQLAYWAVTICTSMMGYFPGIGLWLMELFRGGNEVGAATLANFYGLHIAIIPASLMLFSGWHFWLVRKSGGLVQIKKDDKAAARRVPSVPNLIVREAAVGLGLVAFILVISIFWDAPLHEQANPGMSTNPAKAPWYFLGFQELLLHLHPLFATFVVPVLASAILLFLPFWQGAVLPSGVWFGGKRGRKLALWTFVAGALLTFLFIVLDELLFRSGGSGESLANIINRGYLPLFLFAGLLVGNYLALIRKFNFSRAEAVMAGMMFCCSALVALTITGVWFRGPGMQLTLFW